METPKNREIEQKENGTNVTIRNIWIRHAQKQSGEVANKEGTGMSTSSISKKGEKDAKAFGESIKAAPDGIKTYVSPASRTSETAQTIVKGYEKENTGVKIRTERMRYELIGDPPKEFLTSYAAAFAESRDNVLAGRSMEQLSSDEQETVAEEAEESVITNWLENPNSSTAKAYSPAQAASDFAQIFEMRHEKMAKKLKPDSNIDLLHATHKTITEPFLISGVLIDAETGESITSLQQIGGSLGTLDNWESRVTTDNQGNATVEVTLRNKTYQIDNNVLQRLTSS